MKTAISLLVVVLLAGCAAQKAPPGLISDVQAWRAGLADQPWLTGVSLNDRGDTMTVVVDGYAWDQLPPQAKRDVTNSFGSKFVSLRVKNGLPAKRWCWTYVEDRTGTMLAEVSPSRGVIISK